MRLDGFNPIGTETSGLDMDISSSNSALPFPESEKTVPSLNLTSELSLAQQKGQAAVDLYRIWWEKYDKMTQGDEGTEGWGRMKEEDGDKMSSTFVFCLIALVFSLSFLMVLVAVVCKKWKRRRAAKLSSSRLSLPPSLLQGGLPKFLLNKETRRPDLLQKHD